MYDACTSWRRFLGVTGALMALGCGDSESTASGGGGSGGASGAGGAGGAGGGGGNVSTLEWSLCGDRLECSTLEVPIEPLDPSLGTLTLQLTRLPAIGPELGSLIVLNGGPGNPGSAMVADYGFAIRAFFSGDWSVISLDVRGVEATTPFVRCGDAEETLAFSSVDMSPDDAQERAALDAAVSTWHAGCVEGTDPALLPRTGTVYAAQDLEALRVALGQDQMNVFAGSYGSLLAVRYAELYPERLRAVVIDSSMPPYVEPEALFRTMAIGYQDAIERFFAWCAAGCDGQAACFHGGETVAEVRAAFTAARATIEGLELGRVADSMLFRRLEEARWGELAAGLVDLEGGVVDTLTGPPPEPRPDGTFRNWTDSNNSIQMNDWVLPEGYTGADFDAFVAEMAATVAPDVAGFLASYDPFYVLGEWTTPPTVPPPPYGPVTAPPMLFLVGTHDPSCPLSATEEMVDALDNGSYVAIADGEGHIQSDDVCMAKIAIAFIKDPSLAPTETSCPAP